MQQVIRDWIVTQLKSVSNIGVVHGYQRYADREKQLAELYTHNERLHGWFVRRLSVVEKRLNAGFNIEASTWLLSGFLAINDAQNSEIEFDTLIDAVRAVFRVNANNPWKTIDGKDVSLLFIEQESTEQLGIKVLDHEPVLFAGALCHKVECQLMMSYPIEG